MKRLPYTKIYKDGRVANFKEKQLNGAINKYGYKQVNLDGKLYKVHRLVAEAFIPNPYNYPIINHKDSNTLNNNVENLEWCTQEYNIQYAYKYGNGKYGEKSDKCKLTYNEVQQIRDLYTNHIYTQTELSAIYNIDQGHISHIINYKCRINN